MRHKIKIFLTFSSLVMTTNIQHCEANESRLRANEYPWYTENEDSRKIQIFATPGYYVVEKNAVALSGIAFSLGARYIMAEKLAGGVNLKQAYSTGLGATALFTDLSVKFQYALTGYLGHLIKKVSVKDWPSIDSVGINPGGFRLGISFHQYLLNTTTASIPFTGAGLEVGYEFVNWNLISNTILIQLDSASNGESTITPLSFGWEIAHYL